MVQFGKKLELQSYPSWRGFYLDYKMLKKQLKTLIASSEMPNARSNGQENFKKSLDYEIEKVVLFFLQKQGEFAGQLSILREERQSLSDIDVQAIHKLADGYRKIGDELVRLLQYVELNATGLRKILKKHDKNIGNHKITGSFLTSRVDAPDSHLQQLYHYEGISAIVSSIRTALSELRQLENELSNEDKEPSIKQLLVRSISHTEPILRKIDAARRRLHQSTLYVKTVAARALIFDAEVSEDEDERVAYEAFAERREISEISRLLNLLSTFFYMMNYYIVAPTSGQYASALGATAALSGIIIGMTPIAALASAVVYSWWANRSYKSPLLFASSCLILGNLVYALALPCKSLSMVMIGRLLNGLGGARAINRRYIADNYTPEERTIGSAAFVTAGALGMAAGPAAAAILNFVPDFSVGSILITVETIAGWLMFFVWAIYFSVVFVFFKEPERYQKSVDSKSEHRSSSAELGQGQTSEKTPLLLVSTSNSKKNRLEEMKQRPLYKNIPVVVTLCIYFVLKLVLETLLSSSATITFWYFNWGSTSSGVFLAILGLLMFPTNTLIGYLSYRYDDRTLIIFSEFAMLFGIITIICYGGYTTIQYIIAGVIVFISSNVLEGVNMSLLSKTIPRRYAKGTFNSGLLATEAGTFGRAIGDNLVTLVGLFGLEYILNYTFIPLGLLTIITILLTIKCYDNLEASDD